MSWRHLAASSAIYGLLSGCAQPSVQLPTASDGLPPFPGSHLANALKTGVWQGANAYARSPGAEAVGNSLRLEADQSGLEWSAYVFSYYEDEIPVVATVEAQLEVGSELWVAAADHDNGRWQIFGPFSKMPSVTLDSGFRSVLGQVHLATIVTAGSEALINSVQLTSHYNAPPVAVLTANLTEGNPGANVLLDASASYDPEGSGLYVDWDLDGAGFVPGGLEASTALPDPIGSQVIKVRVRDKAGAEAQASLTLSSRTPGWRSRHIAAGQGSGTALGTLANGGAVLSYSIGGQLAYVKAADATGSFWLDPVTLGQGSLPSLATIQTDPPYAAIAYGADGALRYRKLDTSWTAPYILTGAVGPAALTSLAGKPAACFYSQYYNNADNVSQLLFCAAKNADGTEWGEPVFVHEPDGLFDLILSAALLVAEGNPAICFAIGNINFPDQQKLMYVRALDAAGTQWDNPVLIRSYWAIALSAAMVEGNPAFSYYLDSGSGFTLCYVRATDPLGSAWGSPVSIDPTTLTGSDFTTSLAVIDGQPGIAYASRGYDGRSILCYARSLDATGTGWAEPEIVDSYGNTGRYASLAEIGGKPGISYFSVSRNGLRFAIYDP